MQYKGYNIFEEPNCWGFFKAYDINDYDVPMVYAKTLEGVKTEIDEK